MVRRIKHLLQQDAAAKVLVFSSWQDVLELVSHALHTNKLPYAYARGRKAFDNAVADFKQDRSVESGRSDGIQILLLLVKQGANGLNLTGENLLQCLLLPVMTSWQKHVLVYSMSTLRVRCRTAYSSSVKLLQETSQCSGSI